MANPNEADAQPSSGEIPSWLSYLIGIPLVLFGGIVTTLLGIFLCGYLAGRISGARPDPAMANILFLWLFFGATPFAAGTLLLPDKPSKRRFRWLALLGVLLLFLVAWVDASLGPHNWHRFFAGETFPGMDASKLKHTIVSPSLDTAISKGTNVLWCATFQLAWNEACKLTGGDLQFDQTNSMISALNQHEFTKDCLDESSYVAKAGFVKDNPCKDINAAVEKKFHGDFKQRLIPDKALATRPQDIVAYACLYKHLTFPTPFERLEDSLKFDGTNVPAFGMGMHKVSLQEMYSQVFILDYQNEDDFVIELKTKSDGDRLILAKFKPQPTLGETVEMVGRRMEHGNPGTVTTNDILAVPRMKLDITREYTEIENLRLIPKGANVAKDLNLRSGMQNTAFEMNEKGVELRSEAHMAFGCAKIQEPVSQHKMIFDKPFLVLMQRRDAKKPYFAFWVDNAEALVTWK